MKKSITLIGAGINGLVCANYLQRAGFKVTILERKERVGGACTFDYFIDGKKKYKYAKGASVLGFMQDFVFKETGLSKTLDVYSPQHPEVVYFSSEETSLHCHEYHHDAAEKEFRENWNEHGDVKAFGRDLARVREFLIKGYKDARVPTLEEARKELGNELTARWISGSARDLLDHYFTSPKTKVFHSIYVTESGPISLDAPYSAFNIPLMSSGTVFGGSWGFVKGGIWNVVLSLARINKKLGVKIVTDAKTTKVHADQVTYRKNGKNYTLKTDYVVFATDPLTAAKLTRNEKLVKTVSGKELLGTSGKAVLFFKKPVTWKGRKHNEKDFDMAFKFIMETETMDEFNENSQAVVRRKKDFAPGYLEIYSEGAGLRRLGTKLNHERVAVFFKNLSIAKNGKDMKSVKKHVEELVLAIINNKEDFIGSTIFTPKDIKEFFYFPEGNIDHVELSSGQTFFDRNYSPNPKKSFYQFGQDENTYYCGAGSYPCGSVAGTPGYMCAQQIIKSSQ